MNDRALQHWESLDKELSKSDQLWKGNYKEAINYYEKLMKEYQLILDSINKIKASVCEHNLTNLIEKAKKAQNDYLTYHTMYKQFRHGLMTDKSLMSNSNYSTNALSTNSNTNTNSEPLQPPSGNPDTSINLSQSANYFMAIEKEFYAEHLKNSTTARDLQKRLYAYCDANLVSSALKILLIIDNKYPDAFNILFACLDKIFLSTESLKVIEFIEKRMLTKNLDDFDKKQILFFLGKVQYHFYDKTKDKSHLDKAKQAIEDALKIDKNNLEAISLLKRINALLGSLTNASTINTPLSNSKS